MPARELAARIQRLKDERNAVILAHNYQPAEIQDLADHLGDSLDLSRLAARLPHETIVFCGVRFMAETAAILSPRKRVLLPDPSAGCPLADMIDAQGLRAVQAKHPGSATVMYVNSPAEVKALADVCCTSANAVAVIESVPDERKIIFGPDCHLGGWISEKTDRDMILWDGYCPSHQKIFPEQIRELRARHPGAVVMVHPEVNQAIEAEADITLGTGGMIRYAERSEARVFIVGTEVGMCYRLSKLYPDKTFIPASEAAVCPNMKKITLEKVARALETQKPVITVPLAVADAARAAIERMIEIA